MKVRNSYPEKPKLPYERTSVDMADVTQYIRTLPISLALKASLYTVFRNESANGKSGVCNNYGGIQADSGRWDKKFDDAITGTCVKNENMTGNSRRFVCFGSWHTSIDFLADRLQDRGLFVGGYAGKIAKIEIHTVEDLARAYWKEWVTGSRAAEPSQSEIMDFESMHHKGVALFS
jgi:hypothetical protein